MKTFDKWRLLVRECRMVFMFDDGAGVYFLSYPMHHQIHMIDFDIYKNTNNNENTYIIYYVFAIELQIWEEKWVEPAKVAILHLLKTIKNATDVQ